MAGGRANLGLVATEVERPRLGVAEREGVSESAGEARSLGGWAGGGSRWSGVGTYLSSGWGLLIGLESAVSDGLQRLGS